ncbi:MAG: ASPIC/UnbV domain-containing protein, partial [Planctomycetota bacterium]
TGEPDLVREIDGGSNYLSQNDVIAHFGLGDLTDPIARITIQWSDGSTQVLEDVLPNQTLHVVQSGKRIPDVYPFGDSAPFHPVPEPNGGPLVAAALTWCCHRRRAQT